MKWFESLVQLPTRCEKSFATNVSYSVDPCSAGVLKLVHSDMASFICIHTLQTERKHIIRVIINELKHHWSVPLISLETSELLCQALKLCWDAQQSWGKILYCFCSLPYWQRALVTEFKFHLSHIILQAIITVKRVTLNKEWATEQKSFVSVYIKKQQWLILLWRLGALNVNQNTQSRGGNQAPAEKCDNV